MGIYVQCFSDLPQTRSTLDIAIGVARSARDWAISRQIDDLLFVGTPSENGVWISFYPPNNGIGFEIANNRISFDSKTSIAGPGFHVALIDLCDQLERDLGLRWRWDVGGDETGYAMNRDVNALQAAFADQFLAYCDLYKSAAPDNHYALNLPMGLGNEGVDGIATPLGPVPIEFFQDAVDDREALAENAVRVFPWWHAAIDNKFWSNMLSAILWTEVEWRAPRTEWERHVLRATRRAAARLDLDREPSLLAAMAELDNLCANETEFIRPSAQGIGYKRRERIFFLPGPWHISLPGYYIEDWENDGKTICLWHGVEEVRGDSFTLTRTSRESGPPDFPWSKELRSSADHQGFSCTYRLPDTARPSASVEGFSTAFAEFFAAAPDGTVAHLILSLFHSRSDLIARLGEIARRVAYDPPAGPPTGSYDA